MEQIVIHLGKTNFTVIDLTDFPKHIIDDVNAHLGTLSQQDLDRIIRVGFSAMSCIVSLGQDDFWKVKNSIYAEFVSLVLRRAISPAAAEAMQVSEYVNGLDLIRLKTQDVCVAAELAGHMVEVAKSIAAGDHALAGSQDVREKFAHLADLLRASSLVEQQTPPAS